MSLLEKYKRKTPGIWRKITMISVTLKAGAIAILGLQLATPLPADLTTAAGWTLGACVLITAFAESNVEKTTPINRTPVDCGCAGPCDHADKKL